MSVARDFGDLHDLAIAALAAAIPDAKSVEPYAGQVEDALTAPAARFPFLTVGYGGTSYEAIDGLSYHEINEFEVGIFVQSLRGAEDLKDRAAQMIREVRAALINERLATNAERTVPTRTQLALATDKVQVYAFGFTSALDVEYPEGS